MAIPITPTPVLEGEEAEKFWDKVEAEKNQKLGLVPTPRLEELRREILVNVKRRPKQSAVSGLGVGPHYPGSMYTKNYFAFMTHDDQDKETRIMYYDLIRSRGESSGPPLVTFSQVRDAVCVPQVPKRYAGRWNAMPSFLGAGK